MSERTWILNEDSDYAICYVTPEIAVFQHKRATCAYQVAVKYHHTWLFVEPEFGRFLLNENMGSLDLNGSIYYANDAFRFANDIRRNGLPS